MIRSDSVDHPDPYIPAETFRPPPAANHDNQVACVICRAMAPLAKADVVGMGYRCQACSHEAELAILTGGGDAASHFSAAERKGLSRSGLTLVVMGALVMLLGVVLLGFLRPRWGLMTVVGGVAMMGTGWSRHQAAH